VTITPALDATGRIEISIRPEWGSRQVGGSDSSGQTLKVDGPVWVQIPLRSRTPLSRPMKNASKGEDT
jgi:hypothetical protein